MVKYIDYPDRKTWLANRYKSLGASEIAIVCGHSNFMTEEQLWKEKTLRTQHKEYEGNERVDYGQEAEQYLIELFKLKHKSEYTVDYFPYRVYYNEERPYLTSTLDGLITRLSDSKIGGYECKSRYIDSKQALEEWKGQIPLKYYCQEIHQLYTAGLDFVILNVELRFPDNNAEIREYMINRDCKDAEIDFIVSKGDKFWQYVKTDKKPPLTIRL